MKKLFIVIALFFFASSYLLSEKLEIHHIGIGQGDCTLIVGHHDDGTKTTVLIDAGNWKTKAKGVFRYLDDLLPNYKRIDVAISSHLHADHYGGMTEMLTQFQENNWAVGYVVDKAVLEPISPLIKDDCHQCGGLDILEDPYFENDPVPMFDTRGMLEDYLEKASQFPRKDLQLGTDLFRLTKQANTEIKMICIGANAKILKKYGSKFYDNYENQAQSENDYSYIFLLTFDGFTYLTSGDLGGYSPAYLDLETPITEYCKTIPVTGFHCCSVKINHHGSGHSTNENFLKVLNPTFSIIPSALRSFSGTQIPRKETIDRLKKYNSNIDYTYVPDANSEYWKGKVAYFKDVVITIEDPFQGELKITTRKREKSGEIEFVGPASKYTIECTKHHAKSIEQISFIESSTNSSGQ